MTTTNVWQGDRHTVSWRVTSTEGPVDLSGATVRLLARPDDGDMLVLDCSVDGDVVSHELDGTLPVNRYRMAVETLRDSKLITYPEPDSNVQPELLYVAQGVRP